MNAGVREQIIQMGAGGKCVSPTRAARQLGVSRQRVSQICHEHNIKVAPKAKNYLICNQCGKTFIGKTKIQKFCSTRCFSNYHHIEIECEWCGGHFRRFTGIVSRERNSGHSFCSKRCHGYWTAKNFLSQCKDCETSVCPECGRTFMMTSSKRNYNGKTGLHFCSGECVLKYFHKLRKGVKQ